MPGFVGTYEHSLDAKGRVILPAKFRAAFAQGAYLSRHREGCLALWTPAEFDRQQAVMRERAAEGNAAERNQERLWAAGSYEVEIDSQGRMVIPARLREFAHLEEDVLITGANNRVELWDPALWAQRVEPEEQWFLEDGPSERTAAS